MREWEFTGWLDQATDPDPSLIYIWVAIVDECDEINDDDCVNYGIRTVDSNRLAGVGETCEGFDESTGEPFPSCEAGLVCEDAGMVSIPGAGNVCVIPSIANFDEWLQCF